MTNYTQRLVLCAALTFAAGIASALASITPSFSSSTQNPQLIGWSCFRPGSFPMVDPIIDNRPWNIPVVSTDYDRSQPWNSATYRKYKVREIDGYYGSYNNWNGGETHEFIYTGQAVWGITDILTHGEGLHQFTFNSVVEWDPNITLITNVGQETDGNIFGFSVYPYLNYDQTLTLCEGDGDAALGSGGYGTTTLLVPDTLSDALARASVTSGTLNYSARGLSGVTIPESTAPLDLGEYTKATISFNVSSVPTGHANITVTYSRKNYTTGADLTPATGIVTGALAISGSTATAVVVIPVPANEDEKYTYISAVTSP